MRYTIFSKKIIIISSVLLILTLGAGLAYYLYNNQIGGKTDLARIKNEHPELTSYVDEIASWQEKLDKDKADILNYNGLGLAWKSLAEAAQTQKISDGKEYYNEAFKVYQKGIEVSQRKNTVLMVNAGNMAKYLGDYQSAEDYYKEAIAISPGEVTYYLMLAEFYEYNMKKPKEDIIALYEQGKKRVLNPQFLEDRIDDYLTRHGEK